MSDNMSLPEYIFLDARGIIIKVPYDLAKKSLVLEDYVSQCKDKKKPYYLNYSSDVVHELIDYLSGKTIKNEYNIDKLIDELALEKNVQKKSTSTRSLENFEALFKIRKYLLAISQLQMGNYQITEHHLTMISYEFSKFNDYFNNEDVNKDLTSDLKNLFNKKFGSRSIFEGDINKGDHYINKVNKFLGLLSDGLEKEKCRAHIIKFSTYLNN